jgi:hypothetical protein
MLYEAGNLQILKLQKKTILKKYKYPTASGCKYTKPKITKKNNTEKIQISKDAFYICILLVLFLVIKVNSHNFDFLSLGPVTHIFKEHST